MSEVAHVPGPYEHKGNGYIMAPGRSIVPFAELIDDPADLKRATYTLLSAAPAMLDALEHGATRDGCAIRAQRVFNLAVEALKNSGYEILAGELQAVADNQAIAIAAAKGSQP